MLDHVHEKWQLSKIGAGLLLVLDHSLTEPLPEDPERMRIEILSGSGHIGNPQTQQEDQTDDPSPGS